MIPAAVFSLYVLGIAASLGAMHRIGARNPDTLDECFSGDDVLDLMLAMAWPLFWPLHLAYRLARR